MKKYQTLCELDCEQTTKQQLDELRLFQCLLRSSSRLKDRYHSKELEIAEGLQPWIDALEITLKK